MRYADSIECEGNHMTRLVFTITSVVSLLLFFGSAAVCVRSQFRSDLIGHTNSYDGDDSAAQRSQESIVGRRPRWASGIWCDRRTAETDRGGIIFSHQRADTPSLDGWLPNSGWEFAYGADRRQVRLWPSYDSWGRFTPPAADGPGFRGSATLMLPYWLLLCVFAILPSVTITRAVRNRARPRGVCRKCGYDLRASTERCPECGTPVSLTAKPPLDDVGVNPRGSHSI